MMDSLFSPCLCLFHLFLDFFVFIFVNFLKINVIEEIYLFFVFITIIKYNYLNEK